MRSLWATCSARFKCCLSQGEYDVSPRPIPLTSAIATSGKCLRTIQGHTACITAIEWSPNGRFLATGDVDGWTRLWRTEVTYDVIVGLALRAASLSAVVELTEVPEVDERARAHLGVAAICKLAQKCPVLVGEVLVFV